MVSFHSVGKSESLLAVGEPSIKSSRIRNANEPTDLHVALDAAPRMPIAARDGRSPDHLLVMDGSSHIIECKSINGVNPRQAVPARVRGPSPLVQGPGAAAQAQGEVSQLARRVAHSEWRLRPESKGI